MASKSLARLVRVPAAKKICEEAVSPFLHVHFPVAGFLGWPAAVTDSIGSHYKDPGSRSLLVNCRHSPHERIKTPIGLQIARDISQNFVVTGEGTFCIRIGFIRLFDSETGMV